MSDAAASRPPDRWFGPSGSKRFHYFNDDLRALCGKWMLWRDPVEVGVGWGVAVGNASGDCAACKRALDKLYPPVAEQTPVSAAPIREVGPYRHDVIEMTGVYVSTIYRESSAMEYVSPYFETMAFWLDQTPGILWQSAGRFEREASRQHDLAVRWFSREGVSFSV